MANPRRNSDSPFQLQNQSVLLSIKHFLKKPHAFPCLLSLFVLLTWAFLRLQHSSTVSSTTSFHGDAPERKWSREEDEKANLVRFKSGFLSSKDQRGWLLNPVSFALDSGIKGGAVSCASTHVGEIRPGSARGNHRHHFCNETFVIWGAKTLFRLENDQVVDKGYAEVIVGEDEVAVVGSPSGTAHALLNMDPIHTTYFLGCQDSTMSSNSSNTDFRVWKDV